MRISRIRRTLLATVCGAAAIGLAPPAHAGSDVRDCHDDAVTSLCHKPTRAPTSSSGPDPALQLTHSGNAATGAPPIAVLG